MVINSDELLKIKKEIEYLKNLMSKVPMNEYQHRKIEFEIENNYKKLLNHFKGDYNKVNAFMSQNTTNTM